MSSLEISVSDRNDPRHQIVVYHDTKDHPDTAFLFVQREMPKTKRGVDVYVQVELDLRRVQELRDQLKGIEDNMRAVVQQTDDLQRERDFDATGQDQEVFDGE